MNPTQSPILTTRKSLFLTQEEFAFLLGTDRSTIAKIESGTRKLPKDFVDRFEAISSCVLAN